MNRLLHYRFPVYVIPCLLLLLSCSEDLSTNRKPPSQVGRNALYVAPGGAGIGTQESPLGSLQAALDSIGEDPSLSVLMIAAGQYNEALVVRTPVSIRGGLDPSDEWQPHATDSTVIFGGTIEGHGVGIIIDSVAGAVELRSLTIVAAAASAAGGGSFGLCCWHSEDVSLVNCVIRASSASKGGNGSQGGKREKGDDGATPLPGTLFASGGRGADIEVSQPQTGFCADGSQTGGAYEEDGADGSTGNDGAGGPALVEWSFAGGAWITAASGASGDTGGIGCGGGGGRAALVVKPDGLDILPGGGGGGGGRGGLGAQGGGGGGCSVGLLLYHSICSCDGVEFYSGFGGHGGAGGIGGEGADGGTGGLGRREGVVRARNGGDGGDGGRGGHGGGGAGGWSVGVVLSSGSALTGDSPLIDLGIPGSGGTSLGQPGADGHAVAEHTLVE